jgi:hypothetical protein
MNEILNISPAYLAVIGLFLFIFAQLCRGKIRLSVSAFGLIFIGFFAYKLLMLRSSSELAYSNTNMDFQVPLSSIFYIIVGLNAVSLVLLVVRMTKVSLEKNISTNLKYPILIASGLIIIICLLIYIFLGKIIGAICFPIMTLTFYLVSETYCRKMTHQ